LLIYEALRRERTARMQRLSRLNGARYEAAGGDLEVRDRQLDAQVRERAWIWDYDAEAEASVAAAFALNDCGDDAVLARLGGRSGTPAARDPDRCLRPLSGVDRPCPRSSWAGEF
jgi:hypothetical protein